MIESRYTWLFAAATCVLTLAAVASYREISVMSWSPGGALDTTGWAGDTADRVARAEALPAYTDLYAADADWRLRNARRYSLAELRARGDGRRSPREAMQDRVYTATRLGQRERAVAELDRWVGTHPDDADAMLWLARLLNDMGRVDRSVAVYRRALAVESGRE